MTGPEEVNKKPDDFLSPAKMSHLVAIQAQGTCKDLPGPLSSEQGYPGAYFVHTTVLAQSGRSHLRVSFCLPLSHHTVDGSPVSAAQYIHGNKREQACMTILARENVASVNAGW
jgi:hypothetical protein